MPAERFYFDTVVEHTRTLSIRKAILLSYGQGPAFRNPKFAVMSENPFEVIRKACDSFGKCFQTHLSRILPASCEDHLDKHSSVAGNSKASLFSFFTASNPRAVNDAVLLTPDIVAHLPHPNSALEKKITAAPLTKEELGRATWTLLHTVAAQFPDIPTRQQKRDVKELMAILSRIYPCKECADHFKEVLKQDHKLSSPNGYAMCITL